MLKTGQSSKVDACSISQNKETSSNSEIEDESKIENLKRRATSGDKDALYELGRRYYFGMGVDKNIQYIVKYYKEAAEKGNIPAYNSLGLLYYKGLGTEVDFDKAFTYFQIAAQAGNIVSFPNLARCFLYGKGIDQDIDKAIYWYDLASQKGHAQSTFFLGELFYKGHSDLDIFKEINVEIDYDKSFRYLNKLLEYKNLPDFILSITTKLLSACYRFGRGVEINEEKANEYLKQSAEYGNEDAQKVFEWLDL